MDWLHFGWFLLMFLLCLLTFSQLWFIFLVGASLGIWQKLTKKSMGGISRRFILTLAKNNFFWGGHNKKGVFWNHPFAYKQLHVANLFGVWWVYKLWLIFNAILYWNFDFIHSNIWFGQSSCTTLEYSWNPHPCFIFIMAKSWL